MRFFFNHSYCPSLTVPLDEVYIPTNVTRFYYLKKSVEFTLKATILASLTAALVWGGPMLILVGSAALMFKLSTLLLNQFVPNDRISIEHKDVEKTIAVELHAILKGKSTILTTEQFNQIESQKEVSLYVLLGFMVFTAGCAGLSWPIVAAAFALGICMLETSTHCVKLDADLIQEDRVAMNLG